MGTEPLIESRQSTGAAHVLAQILMILTLLFAVLPSEFASSARPAEELIEGSWLDRIKWTALFIIAFFMLWKNARTKIFHHINANPIIWLLLAYCTASIFWSPQPLVSTKRAIQLFGLMLIGMAVSTIYRGGQTGVIQNLFWTLIALLLASALMVSVNPSIGIESSSAFELAGAWKGIMDQKNSFGMASAICCYLWVILWFDKRLPSLLSAFTLMTALGCLIMARSSTAITMAALSTFTYILLRLNYIKSELWLMRGLFVFFIFLSIATHFFYISESRFPNWSEVIDPFAQLFGKESDLSGRSSIWKFMWLEVEKHPITGIGYGAFWIAPPEGFLDNFSLIFYQAHNGYIDLINELGVLGLALFVGMMIYHIRNLYRLTSFNRSSAAFHAGLLLIYLVSNITETSVLRGLNILHVLLTLSFFIVSEQIRPNTFNHPDHIRKGAHEQHLRAMGESS